MSDGAPAQLGLFAAPRRKLRHELDSTSWVELVPGWLAEHESLFAALRALPTWRQRERRMYTKLLPEPRLTVEVRDLSRAPDPRLTALAHRLSRQYGVAYDGLWMNFYRDGRDSTAWHGDKISCRGDEATVPVLTLGAARRFLLKPRESGSSITLTPESGDLVVMGGRCQRDWVHSVPKTSEPSGARISVNFQSSDQARAR